MAQGLTIREARAHDAPAIQRIYNREIAEGVATLDEWPWSDARRRAWFEERRGELTLVALGGDSVVGAAWLTPFDKSGYRFTREASVFVDRAHHRRGVGRRLAGALVEGARERGLHALLARIEASNAASLGLFAALGFERSGLRREVGYKHGRWIDIAEMQLLLQPAAELEARAAPGFRAALVADAAALDEALAVRRAVFVEEQGVPEDEEIDRHDGDPAATADAVHALGRLDGRPVATARLLLGQPAGEYPHVGRVAVLAAMRGRGYGAAIMRLLHEEARRRGHAGVTLAAQEHAAGFYARLGYAARGGLFLDAGIEHRWMDLAFGGGPPAAAPGGSP